MVSHVVVEKSAIVSSIVLVEKGGQAILGRNGGIMVCKHFCNQGGSPPCGLADHIWILPVSASYTDLSFVPLARQKLELRPCGTGVQVVPRDGFR
jgi:hypothetical protein